MAYDRAYNFVRACAFDKADSRRYAIKESSVYRIIQSGKIIALVNKYALGNSYKTQSS